MRQFDLIIFDCDGVLVNSEQITSGVMAAMLQEMGVNVSTTELHDQLHGQSMAQYLEQMAQLLGRPLPETFVPELRQRAAAALYAQVTPINGVSQALARIQTPICVASSGEAAKVQLTLGRTGLLDWFGGRIFTAADVTNPKPAPDIYLLAAQQQGVDPRRCAVIEDSPTGVRAGAAAGMTVFGFAADTPAQALREAGASVIFHHMSQLPTLLHSC